jgi:hypothetical protein
MEMYQTMKTKTVSQIRMIINLLASVMIVLKMREEKCPMAELTQPLR